MRSVLNIGLACVLALAFVSCAQPPEEELKAAEAAIAKAQNAEADIYATEVFRNAKNTLADARAKVEKSDYEGAKASAIRAKELADQSASQAASSKSQMSQQRARPKARVPTRTWTSFVATSDRLKHRQTMQRPTLEAARPRMLWPRPRLQRAS